MEIDKTTTKRQILKLHRELWDWLYHNPTSHKSDWPRWKYRGGDIEADNDCFLCIYMVAVRTEIKDCCKHRCPMVWPGEMGDCLDDERNDEQGLFALWENAGTRYLRKKYAALIRDLPTKKGA